MITTHPLNRSGRVRALGRFLQWQASSRLIRRPIVLPFVDDTHLVTETGMIGSTANYYYGLLEMDEMGFALHALRPDDLFVDIGANVGSYTLLAAVAGATIVAVEPLPHTFERLMRNIRFNEIDAETHRCGLSARPGNLRFTVNQDAMNHVAEADDAGPTLVVPVTTLDTLLAERVPFMIKIDVEGHEPQLIEGAARTLADCRLQAVLMETTRNVSELMAQMRKFGFTPHYYDAIKRRLYPAQQQRLNTIFLRDRSMIERRCQSARYFSLVNGSI